MQRNSYNQHVTWLPGEPFDPTAGFERRHLLGNSWIPAVKALVPEYPVYKIAQALMHNSYTVRALVRNSIHIACAVICKHGPEYNSIKAVGVNQSQPKHAAKWQGALIYDALLELPELPGYFRAPKNVRPSVLDAFKLLGFIEVDPGEYYRRSELGIQEIFNRESLKLQPNLQKIGPIDESGRPDSDGDDSSFGAGLDI